MKNNGRTKALSLLLALVMLLSLVPAAGLTAFASGAAEQWTTDITVTESRTINGHVSITADITLTINEGVTLTVEDSLEAPAHTITVNGKGTLDVTGSAEYCAILGNLVVDGATVNAKGGSGKNGADNNPPEGIYNGERGSSGADGISGNVTVKSGCVNAYGGNGGNGGTSETLGASGGNGGAGVSGNVTLEGGSFTAIGGKGGNGGQIFMGGNGSNGSNGVAVSGTITGGNVEESDDNNTWTAVSGGSSSKRYVRGEVIPTAYTVALAEGTEDAANWTITPSENLDGGEPVTITYNGDKKVKNVTAATTGAALAAPKGAISGVFTINADGDKVYFSKGNLQLTGENTWQFATNQYDYFGDDQSDNHRDLFGWGTGEMPNKVTADNKEYGTFTDWGNNSSLQTALGTCWRTLTMDEWAYLFNETSRTETRYCKATVDGKSGIVLFPDSYTPPAGIDAPASASVNNGDAAYNTNSWNATEWAAMETAGCVFLPAAGGRYGSSVGDDDGVGTDGRYWSSTSTTNSDIYAYRLRFH
ncbi:MAG: hypothetical protein J5482_01175 [Oscillospiraceae bacterium]|nr:hypothetical protein [Oscillospiraceae bacterium]